MRKLNIVFGLCIVVCTVVSAQNSGPASPTSGVPKSAQAETQAAWHPVIEDMLPEIQRNAGKHQTIALVWWMPAEYFEAAQTSASKQLDAFRNNTVFGVVFAKIAPFGLLDFAPVDKIRSSVVVRDALGAEYKPIDKLSDDVRVPLEIMKPMFSSSLGKLGENIQFLVFAGKDQNGKRIAEPRSNRDFSVEIKELAGEPHTVVTWRLPLSAMFPPRFCPVGKEKVEASWKFCPWHGVPLVQPQ